jgi:serine/threonine-protein kinase
MGVVYLAERADLGSLAAIKVLRDAWISPARRERFAAEQRTLAQLRHPGIAQLLDADSLSDGTPWIAMEYVDGVALTEYCRAHDTTIEGRLELLRSVCQAVQHAHGQAIVHRDLKPSNVLVQADGSVKLLDFGIAKHLEGLDGAPDVTRTGLRLLTPAYAAPEQLRGGRVGIHSDVYSLGVILYELLCQRTPFDPTGRAPAEAASLLLETEPERPSALARRALADGARSRSRTDRRVSWPDLDVLCLTALHPDPARRYPTVDALIRDIDHYLADEPLWARPDAFGYRLGKFVRRHRAPVLAAAVALLAVVGVVAFYTARLAEARDEALRSAERTAGAQRFLLNLFQGGDEAAGPAEDLRVLTVIERGVEEARALADQPVQQAELFRDLGPIFQQLGRFDQADELLQAALDTQSALFGDDDPETAATRVALGLLRVDQARFDEAERSVRSGLGVLRERLGPTHPLALHAQSALGRALEARGDYDAAIAANEELVRLCSDAGDEEVQLAGALGQLADSHYYAGHYDTADALNRELLAVTRRLYGERHPHVAVVQVNLGASLADRARYAEAEALYRPALAILRDFHGPDDHRAAACATMLGRVLVYQGQLDEGVELLASALAVQERVHGPTHPAVASALNDLGMAALQEERLDDAEASFGRMLAIYRAIHAGEEHYLLGTATSNLASVFVAREDYARAEGLYRDAVAIFERTLSPTHLNTGIGRIKLGRALLRQGRPAEAERESLAGYAIVAAEAAPTSSWLVAARADLVAAYEALGQPERAAAYREP